MLVELTTGEMMHVNIDRVDMVVLDESNPDRPICTLVVNGRGVPVTRGTFNAVGERLSASEGGAWE